MNFINRFLGDEIVECYVNGIKRIMIDLYLL